MTSDLKRLPICIEEVYRYDEIYRGLTGESIDPSIQALKIVRGPLYLERVELSPAGSNHGDFLRTDTGLIYNNVYARHLYGNEGRSVDWLNLGIKSLKFSLPTWYTNESPVQISIGRASISSLILKTKTDRFNFNQSFSQINVFSLDIIIDFSEPQTYLMSVTLVSFLAFLINIRSSWRGTPHSVEMTATQGNQVEVFFEEDSHAENAQMYFDEPWPIFAQKLPSQFECLTDLLGLFPIQPWWEPTLFSEHRLARRGFTTDVKLLIPNGSNKNSIALRTDFAHAFDYFEMVLRAEYLRRGYLNARKENMKTLLEKYMSPSTTLKSYTYSRNNRIKESLQAALKIRNALHHTFLSTPLGEKELRIFQNLAWMDSLANEIWEASWCILALDTLNIDEEHFVY